MKNYPTQNIRNVVLLGNAKSGKTTLAEAMLFEGKIILYTEFMNNKLNIIDTPGSDDFVGGVISAFKVADSGVMIINAQQGIEVGTEIFARYAEQYKMPLLIGVNQLDHEKANWDTTIDALHQTFGKKVVIIQFPVETGLNFNAFIDVLKMKMYRFKDDNGTREELDIPAEYADHAAELQQQLIEMAAENDESLMEIFFEKGVLTEDEIRSRSFDRFGKMRNYACVLPLRQKRYRH